MQVSSANDVKIYNLSVGKSLPEWISDRKKRQLQKNDAGLRCRIELIQDFKMPTVSTSIRISKDNQYIIAAGTYKPRLRCYDVSQLSMKFERCFDAEAVTFELLDDDYSKMVLLQADRYVEFHARYGRYYRTRIPKFGRDMKYHSSSCDLYFVGASNEVMRLNLEEGRFMTPFITDASELNCCDVNPEHYLLAVGSTEGKVECWDPRVKTRVGLLDCALSVANEDNNITDVTQVSKIKFKDALTMAVGTSTGQVLLYDIRSRRPIIVKDHQYGEPIKSIAFTNQSDNVMSCDSKILKIWDRHDGKLFTSIEPDHKINDLCVCQDSGLIFMANESSRILAYYIPSLGPAPRWCSFLDNITEELEENPDSTVYDDYKFLTRKELEDLGLSHIVGTGLVRAYMHGFFIDIRLYHKARALADPFAYEEYRKNKIRQKIEEARANRVRVQKLPQINKALAHKLMTVADKVKSDSVKKQSPHGLLKDCRFSALFSDPNMEVDPNSDEYKLLNPVVTARTPKPLNMDVDSNFDEIQDEPEGRASSDDNTSSDDDRTWVREVRQQHRAIRREKRVRTDYPSNKTTKQEPKFYEMKKGQTFMRKGDTSDKNMVTRMSLSSRLEQEKVAGRSNAVGSSSGSKEITFKIKPTKEESKTRQDMKQHQAERQQLRRSTKSLRGKGKSWR